MFPGVTVWLKEGAHMGHGSIVHGAVIGKNCMIGMNSVIMDNVEIGEESIVGALSFVREGEKIPPRSLVVGHPAKVIKEVSPEMLKWKTEGTALYQALPTEMQEEWRVCEPLRPEGDPGGEGFSGEQSGAPERPAGEGRSGKDAPGGGTGEDRSGEARPYKPWKETNK
jgi:hypothetical protein